jgi:hypothetical protein
MTLISSFSTSMFVSGFNGSFSSGNCPKTTGQVTCCNQRGPEFWAILIF